MSVLDGLGCPRGHASSRQIVEGFRAIETRQARGVESRRETTNDDRTATKTTLDVGEDSRRVETSGSKGPSRPSRRQAPSGVRTWRIETESAEAGLTVRGHDCCDLQTLSLLESRAHEELDVFRCESQASE
jgi:hypothetical protein